MPDIIGLQAVQAKAIIIHVYRDLLDERMAFSDNVHKQLKSDYKELFVEHPEVAAERHSKQNKLFFPDGIMNRNFAFGLVKGKTEVMTIVREGQEYTLTVTPDNKIFLYNMEDDTVKPIDEETLLNITNFLVQTSEKFSKNMIVNLSKIMSSLEKDDNNEMIIYYQKLQIIGTAVAFTGIAVVAGTALAFAFIPGLNLIVLGAVAAVSLIASAAGISTTVTSYYKSKTLIEKEGAEKDTESRADLRATI